MLIKKTLPLGETEFKFTEDSGQFKGYASVFGGVDSYRDTILKGAYLETLKEHGIPKMFYNHKWDMPIGKYTNVDEDSKGLWVEGELTPGHSRAADVRASMLHQTLDGLSIGGMLRKGDYKDGNEGGRIIHKWTVLKEVSPVVFPADGSARIDLDSVKYADEMAAIETIRDFEYFLRDAGNFSKGAAQALTARAKALFTLRDAGDNEVAKQMEDQILDRLHKMSQ
ncbi:HK97 family phage prohead protease [Massilia sp.]|uniref:HK97 family phage prohead protease n=1 Tax=Massilia sp. TaxID=1882437 RepID=UPI00352F2CAD